MRVNVYDESQTYDFLTGAETEPELVSKNVELSEVLEGDEFAFALTELEGNGTTMVGGGAAPLFRLTNVEME